MGTTATTAPSRTKGVMGSWLWWRPDPGELERQVTQYASLNAFQSARGVSAILCVLTVGVTALFAQWIHLSATAVEIEAVIWLSLGFFMYRGHRWAFMLAMVLWTYEKGSMLLGGISPGRAPFAQVIWWMAYMNAFYLGFKVEGLRASAPPVRAR